jgi:hypothetical protein
MDRIVFLRPAAVDPNGYHLFGARKNG